MMSLIWVSWENHAIIQWFELKGSHWVSCPTNRGRYIFFNLPFLSNVLVGSLISQGIKRQQWGPEEKEAKGQVKNARAFLSDFENYYFFCRNFNCKNHFIIMLDQIIWGESSERWSNSVIVLHYLKYIIFLSLGCLMTTLVSLEKGWFGFFF